MVFLGGVTVSGRVDLDDWLEVRLVTIVAGDWSAVSYVAAESDWLEEGWVEAAGNWLTVLWLAGEGDWLEVRWVAGAEFGSSVLKLSILSSIWAGKMWIDASGTDT